MVGRRHHGKGGDAPAYITTALGLGRRGQSSSHSVTNLSLACMSTCRRRVVPEFTNLCGTPAGTTTTCPPLTSIVSSPAVKVALALLVHEDLLVWVSVQLRAASRRGVYHYERDTSLVAMSLEGLLGRRGYNPCAGLYRDSVNVFSRVSRRQCPRAAAAAPKPVGVMNSCQVPASERPMSFPWYRGSGGESHLNGRWCPVGRRS